MTNATILVCALLAAPAPFWESKAPHDWTDIEIAGLLNDAAGHVAAMAHLKRAAGVTTLNLGTGRGHSVLEVVAAFERARGRPIARRIAPRRAGDVAICYADPTRAEQLLGWHAARDLDAICADAWRWQVNRR